MWLYCDELIISVFGNGSWPFFLNSAHIYQYTIDLFLQLIDRIWEDSNGYSVEPVTIRKKQEVLLNPFLYETLLSAKKYFSFNMMEVNGDYCVWVDNRWPCEVLNIMTWFELKMRAVLKSRKLNGIPWKPSKARFCFISKLSLVHNKRYQNVNSTVLGYKKTSL